MKYNLSQPPGEKPQKKSVWAGLKTLFGLMSGERKFLTIAFVFIMVNAALSLLAPVLIGYTIDHYVQPKLYHGVLVFSGILLVMYLITLVTSYLQTKLMGTVGQRMLFNLRNNLFNKLQELPVDFFNQNRAGDLISRINNDTDKINQFVAQSLVQFLSSFFIMIGAAIFLLSINFELGLAALSPALFILLITKSVSPWVKSRNAISMKNVGNLSAEIQESLNNFKVIIAFNRRDYFRRRFDEVNLENYTSALKAGIANNSLMPVYSFFSNIGQMIVLSFGIYLIAAGQFSIGLLISFLSYINYFYNPLRQLASIWANLQVALAGWDRISQILSLESNLEIIDNKKGETSSSLLSFKKVTFSYPNGKPVLHNVNFDLEAGKTYAFVGPTGGGKTTTASLIARLYDTTKGTVILDGKDIRSYTPEERTDIVGFILQEPFLFTGSVRDNILYGNKHFTSLSNEELMSEIHEAGLESLLERFDKGLETVITLSGDGISLGQKQLIAFIRAVLRKPKLLILDEATANIDTVTEKLLDAILLKLPASTTRVIIAHRLNTIENADEIYFVNSGNVTRAGSLDDAVKLLLHGKLES